MRRSLLVRWGVVPLLVALLVDPSWVGRSLEGLVDEACTLFESRGTTQALLETLLARPFSVAYAGVGSLKQAGMKASFVLIKIASERNKSKVVEPDTRAVGAGLAEHIERLFDLDTDSDVRGREGVDEVDPWPITALTFVVLHKDWKAEDCAKARAIYDFLIWCATKKDAAAVAENNEFSSMPESVQNFTIAEINKMTCGGTSVNQTEQPVHPIEINAAGSSLAGLLFTQLSIEYHFKERWNVVISYDATGSGTGHRLAEAGVIDFAASDRVMKPGDLGPDWLFVPLYATAVVVMANVHFADSIVMTQEVVHDVFTAGMACWSDPRLQELNPLVELPEEPIRRTVRNKTSGTTSTFTLSLARMVGLHDSCTQHPLQCSGNPDPWPQLNASLVAAQSAAPAPLVAGCPVCGAAEREGRCACVSPAAEEEAASLSWLARNQGVLVLGIVASVFAGVGAGVVLLRSLEHRADKLWRVEWNEVNFPDPPEILGQGSFGVVTKVVFRGDWVACKRLLSPGEAAQAWRLHSPRNASRAPHREPHVGSSKGARGTQEEGEKESGEEAYEVLEALVGPRGAGLNRETRRRMMTEMKVMVRVRHHNLCPLMGACLDFGREFLLMEYFEYGSIRDMMDNRFPLTRDIQMDLVAGIAAGMQYLHLSTPALLHKDLKAANVLVDVKLTPKLSDFGMASTTSKQGERVGTVFWNAPELLAGQGASTGTDVYAYALTVYEIFHPLNFNLYPRHMHPREIVAGVREGWLRPVIATGAMDAQLQALVQESWDHDPAARPNFSEIVERLRGIQSAASQHPERIDLPPESEQHYAMFPANVAALLKSGLKVQPQRLEGVSLVFADVYRDSPAPAPSSAPSLLASSASARSSFSEASEESEGCGEEAGGRGRGGGKAGPLYQRMEELAAREGLFKVRTIGSSFLAAAGVPEPQGGHASRVARFATALLEAVREMEEEEAAAAEGGGRVEVRIGCHTGSVVASVVGKQTLQYCLFGATVNIASRLELSSRPGWIHVSSRLRAELLREDPDAWKPRLIPRASRQQRRPGVPPTYWLAVDHPALASPPRPAPLSDAAGDEECDPSLSGRRVLFSDGPRFQGAGSPPAASSRAAARSGGTRRWFLPTLYRSHTDQGKEPEAICGSGGKFGNRNHNGSGDIVEEMAV